jgi:hypothetical protein
MRDEQQVVFPEVVDVNEAFARSALAPTLPSFRKVLRVRYGLMVPSGGVVDLAALDAGNCDFVLLGATVTGRGR